MNEQEARRNLATAARVLDVTPPELRIHSDGRQMTCSLAGYRISVGRDWLDRMPERLGRWAIWHEVKTLAIRDDIQSRFPEIEELRSANQLTKDEMTGLLDAAVDLFLEGPYDYALATRAFLDFELANPSRVSEPRSVMAESTVTVDLVLRVKLALASYLLSPSRDGELHDLANPFHWWAFLRILVDQVAALRDSGAYA